MLSRTCLITKVHFQNIDFEEADFFHKYHNFAEIFFVCKCFFFYNSITSKYAVFIEYLFFVLKCLSEI